MAVDPSPKKLSLFRQRGTAEGERVEYVELFFDLVFVFAVTRLSHTLLEELSGAGALKVALLLGAVWWVWIYTSWVTNWLAPERLPVRLCLFVMMGAGLLLAVAIPHAFAEYALLFAASYVFIQQGRLAYTYIHILIVAGIIVSAVADELLLTHGDHGVPWIVILAGPLLYLAGTALFKWVMNDRRAPPFSHLAGFALLLALIWPAHSHLFTTLGLGITTSGVLLVVAIWESIALARPARAP